MLNNAKRTYYSNLLHENGRNTSKTWDAINEFTSRKDKDIANYLSGQAY